MVRNDIYRRYSKTFSPKGGSGDFGPSWPEVGRPSMTAPANVLTSAYMAESRELTRPERAAIRKLVIDMCANYCREYGCLPLDCDCYMFGKCWTGGYCKYFQRAVLPLDPILEASLLSATIETRLCALCGVAFPVNGKKAYCSDACAGKAHRKQKRDSIRKKRGSCRHLPYYKPT